MVLEIVFFAGAAVLVAALIYGVVSSRHRDRAAIRAADEITRQRYREEDAGAATDHASTGEAASRDKVMPARGLREPNGIEPDFSEDDIQRNLFGPRGVPGAPDPAKMTTQRAKKTPSFIDQGHVS